MTSGGEYLATGISWGWFDLVIEVPPGFVLTKATANYQNGLLRVLVPQVG